MSSLTDEDPDGPGFVYDEFGHFHENCAEYGLAWDEIPQVRRVHHELDDGRSLSGLLWGQGDPDLVLIHGGAQNAHTWDTVALALRPTAILAVDLPGHGHSGWRTSGPYTPRSNADDVAQLVAAVAPQARVVAGMSLGGLTANALAAHRPELVRRLVVVDITPGVTRDKAADVHAFIEGPQRFASFREIFDRTVEYNPTRSPESLRRGILHNAHRLPSGEWEWNYHRRPLEAPADDTDPLTGGGTEDGPSAVEDDLWGDVERIEVPYLLVRGSLSPVVDDDDVAELVRLQPSARIVVVDGAGHSVQGDRPLELADLLRAELSS